MGLLRDRGRRVQLDIIGAGPDEKRLVAQIARLELGDRIRLRGMAVWEEIRAAYVDLAKRTHPDRFSGASSPGCTSRVRSK